jgi:sorbitol-specific phosphotransferase system component IIBC
MTTTELTTLFASSDLSSPVAPAPTLTFSIGAVTKLLEYATDKALDLCNADMAELTEAAKLNAFLDTEPGDNIVVAIVDVKEAMRDRIARKGGN